MRGFAITLVVAVSCLGFLTWTEAKSRGSRQNAPSPEDKEKEKLLETIRKLAGEAGHEDSDNIGKGNQKGVCYTKRCLEASIEFLEAMNFNAYGSICSNASFGEFACHRRIHRPADDWHKSQFGNQSLGSHWKNGQNQFTQEFLNAPVSEKDSPSFQAAKVAYQQCYFQNKKIDFRRDATSALYSLTENLGGWPLLTGQPLKQNYDPFEVIAFISQFQTTTSFFDIQSVKRANGRQEIILDKGTIMYDNKASHYNYLPFIKSINSTWIQHKEILSKDWVVIASEANVEKSIKSMDSMRTQIQENVNGGVGRSLSKMTISELNKYTTVDWLKFFIKVFQYSHMEITPETIVHVNKPYLKSVLFFIDGVKKFRTPVANILQYDIWSNWWPYTLINDSPVDCYDKVKKDFGATLSKEYLKKSKFQSTKEVKKDVASMLDLLLDSLYEAIGNSSMLTDEARKQVVEKFKNVKKFIGYAPWLDDDAKFNRFHEKLEKLEYTVFSWLQNNMRVEAWKTGVLRDNLEKEIDHYHYWDLNSFIVDPNGANYFKGGNSMKIPQSFILPPNYDNRLPGYWNFGAIGMVMGHELGHGMDPEGILFDKDGNMNRKNWLDEQSKNNYKNWTNEIKEIYRGSEIHYHGPPTAGIDKKLDPDLTIGEDVADTIGLGLGIRAYRKWLKQQPGQKDVKLPGLEQWTDEQLFYVRYSNYFCAEMSKEGAETYKQEAHSPDYTRATVPLKFSKEFADTFKCTAKEIANLK